MPNSSQGSLDAQEFGIQHYFCLVFVLAALRSAQFFLFSGFLGLFRFCLEFARRFFFCTFHGLSNLHRVGVLFANLDQGKSKKRQSWDHLLLNTSEKTIQSIGCFARFTHHDLITDQDMLISWFQKVFLEKQPLQCFPRKNGMIKPLNGSITSTFLCPARQTEHRDSSTSHQHPKHDLAYLA